MSRRSFERCPSCGGFIEGTPQHGICPSCGWRSWGRVPDEGGLPAPATTPATHARRGDPDTSKAAAVDVDHRRVTHQKRILAAYAQTPEGLTPREAAEMTGIDGGWKRVSDLLAGGYLARTSVRRVDRQTRKMAYVLVITDKGRAAVG